MSTAPAPAPSEEVLAAAAEACAREPIRVPGAVQPHGVLLAVDLGSPDVEGGDPRVVVASATTAGVLGLEPDDVLGRRLDDLVPGLVPRVRAVAAGGQDDGGSPVVPARGPGRDDGRPGAPQDALLHAVGDLVVVELEPLADGARDAEDAARAAAAWYRALPPALRRLQGAASVAALADALVGGVRELTGFDRVMVYRFDPDWNGEVVAEERRDDLEPFLGLHYPASDIPAQARALYERQWLRIIVDVSATPAPLVPAVHPGTGAPLDLSGAALRAVSPVHLQYLANMGVAASMSISLLHEGRLWGLVACHHYAGPHRPAPAVRAAAEFLGRTASLLLPTVTGHDAAVAALASSRARTALAEELSARPDLPLDALTRARTTLADLVPCGGVAVRLHGQWRLIGTTPPQADVEALLARVLGPQQRTFATSSLAGDHPDLAHLSAVASGVLATSLDATGDGDVVAWFRPEVLQEVTWGGDPHKNEVVDDGTGLHLSPRRSFAAWTELRRRTAVAWAPHEVETATSFAAHVRETILRRVESTHRLASTLQRTLLLESLPELPGLQLAARYAPFSDDVVGGDWYDVVPLASGRVAVALGDVAGHGLAVAAITAQVRNALRAYLVADESPAVALARLNGLVVALLPGELVTGVVAVIDPAEGKVEVALAGHPPPVLLAQGRPELVDGARGPALGLLDEVEYASTTVPLPAGHGLLLYTDGLVEQRAGDDAVAPLLELARDPGPDLAAFCDRLTSSLSSHADDSTVLVVRTVALPGG